ncbi:MAG: trimethylamine methyltransferase family protein [Pseudomonadota bacterium]
MKPYAVLHEQDLSKIESQAALILSEIGVELQNDAQSLEAMASTGARIENMRVYPDADALRDLIASAPPSFKWHGATGAAAVDVGGNQPVIAPTFGPPRVQLYDGTIRLGTLADYRALVLLCDEFRDMDSTGFLLCIPHDGVETSPYIDMARAHLDLSDKPMMGTVISEEALRGVAAAVGVTDSESPVCRLLHMVNLTPPLVYQPNPLQCLRASSLLGQATVVSSYMMMGATAPVSVAGALAQGLAEILVGLALTQIYRPGAPIVGGLFATPFSMQFMGPIFGTPESFLAQVAGCQLVRRLGIPTRGDGMLTSSKTNDAQAGYEGSLALGASALAGADLILHSAGWLDFGRLYGMDKLRSDMALLAGTRAAYANARPDTNERLSSSAQI